jgi:hypothetical protein
LHDGTGVCDQCTESTTELNITKPTKVSEEQHQSPAEIVPPTAVITTFKSNTIETEIVPKKREKVEKTSLSTPKPKRPKKNKPCADTMPKLTASHFHPKDPRLAKLSVSDVKMVSKRRLRDKQDDVPYDIELVPAAKGCSVKSLLNNSGEETEGFNSMLGGSVLLKLEGQDGWQCTEMLQLCSEASWRRVLLDRKLNPSCESHITADAKPLTLEYICDRLDTDDPIYGYQVIENKYNKKCLFATATSMYAHG